MNDPAEFLRRVINARAVAVVGASGDTAKFGGRVMRFLTQHAQEGIAPFKEKRTPRFKRR